MKQSCAGDRFAVFDDFLSDDALAALRCYAAQRAYEPVESVVNAAVDGSARRSRGGLVHASEQLASPELGPAAHAVMNAAIEHQHIYGKPSESWDTMSFAFWRYEAGTRLGWHNDAGNGRTGEYILYLHDQWRPSWGGELMLLDEFSPVELDGLTMQQRSEVLEEKVSSSNTMITAIVPRPNRLVMVKAGTSHYINRVDKAAGGALRCSMTGFMSRAAKRSRDADRLSILSTVLGWQEESPSEADPRGLR